MNGLVLDAVLCLLGGSLAALHPCPLTTNIAALGLLTGWARGFWHGLRLGSAYAGGFALIYLGFGIAVGVLGWGMSEIAGDLPRLMGWLSGPLFVLAGMVQVGLLRLPDGGARGRALKERLQRKRWSMGGAWLLGMVLGLAFCPGTASAFFAIGMPLIVEHRSLVLLPLLFGLGAALPLLALAAGIAGGVRLGDRHPWIAALPRHAGWLVIAIGVYLILVNTLLG